MIQPNKKQMNSEIKRRITMRTAAILFLIAIIFIAAIVIRKSAIGVSGLWLDEIYGVSYINLNPFELIVAVLRFDVQPPLYYLQLKLWGMPSHSDAWLLSNSIAWSIGALASATYGAYKFAGKNAALITAALTAFLGSEIYYSSEVRMYSMISCLALIGWIRAEYWARNPNNKNSIWLVVVTAMLAATHSAAVVVISSILLYAISNLALRVGIKGALVSWKIIIATGIFLSPWLINASLRSVGQTTYPSIHAVIETVSGWLLGYGAIEIPYIIKMSLALMMLLIIIMGLIFGNKTIRLLILTFIIWPLAFAATISVLIRPIWIPRLFAFCAPFFSLAIGLLLSDITIPKHKYSSINVFLSLFIASSCLSLAWLGWNQNHKPWKMQYRTAAHFISKNNLDRLPIYIPNNKTFWGIARYLAGPDWGSILKIQDPKKPDHSVIWEKIYHRLGRTWLNRLGLSPKTRELKTPNGTMWIGYSPLPKNVPKYGMWLIGNNSLLDSLNNCPMSRQINLWRFRGVVIVRCSKESTFNQHVKSSIMSVAVNTG